MVDIESETLADLSAITLAAWSILPLDAAPAAGGQNYLTLLGVG